MKLHEIHEQAKPIFAWLDPARGPEDIRGVRLAYIQPLAAHFDDVITKAEEEAREGDDRAAQRVERLLKDKEAYMKRGQRFFTPDMGWWTNEEEFHSGREGFGGATRGNILARYPHVVVVGSREEAIKGAEEAGLI